MMSVNRTKVAGLLMVAVHNFGAVLVRARLGGGESIVDA